jgi:hypothetical protein
MRCFESLGQPDEGDHGERAVFRPERPVEKWTETALPDGPFVPDACRAGAGDNAVNAARITAASMSFLPQAA